MRACVSVCTVVLVLTTACQWKSDGALRMATLYPEHDSGSDLRTEPDLATWTSEFSPGTDAATGGIVLEEIQGAWVLEMELPGTMELFPGFAPYELLITNRFLVEITGTEAELRFCHQQAVLDADGLGATQMLPETEDAIGEESIFLEVEEGSGIAAQTVVWTWGLEELAKPAKAPLPDTPDDPLVWDQDGDGHPGITIKVLSPEGFRYMVRRGIWNLEPPAAVETGEHLAGKLAFQVHESAVGYDGLKSLETIVPIVPDPSGGTYQLVRNDSTITCQKLRQDEPGVFE